MNMVQIVNSTSFSRALVSVVTEIDKAAVQPAMLLDAIRNWFSKRNAGFYPNFWEFRSIGILLHLDYSGIYLKVSDPEACLIPADQLLHLNQVLALSVGEDSWTITFLTNFPESKPIGIMCNK
jgi:hypothetical protein